MSSSLATLWAGSRPAPGRQSIPRYRKEVSYRPDPPPLVPPYPKIQGGVSRKKRTTVTTGRRIFSRKLAGFRNLSVQTYAII